MPYPIKNADPFFNDNKPRSISKLPIITLCLVIVTLITTATYVAINVNNKPTTADELLPNIRPLLNTSAPHYTQPLTPPAPQ